MVEAESARVEHLPRRVGDGPCARFAVDTIAEDRMAGRGKMHADLVRAAGLEPDGDEARPGQDLERPVPRHGAEALLAGAGDAAPPVATVADEVRPELAGGREAARDERDVFPLDRVALEELLQRPERLPAAGEEERPGGLLVQAVHHAHVGPPAIAVLEVR